jgi:dTDP-4-amino-4,6-dideoxygalactose transaminase
MRKFITFGKPCYDKNDIRLVNEVLRSKWIGTGKKTLEFEKNFSKYKKIKYSLAVSSCTAALHLSLLTLNIKKGDEVITTPLTFCSTINSILHVGAIPVLADIDEDTLNIDPKKILNKISKKTKAIIVVHFAGLSCDMDEILKISRKYSIKVIEDCAHAIETKYKNKQAGTLGDTGCFSFYSTKNITTSEGGMLTTKNKKLADRVNKLRLHGLSRDAWKRYSNIGKYKTYNIFEPGYKYNLTNMNAALGINQLKKINFFWKKRKKIWDFYNSNLGDLPIKLPPKITKGYKHAYHLYTIIIDKSKTNQTSEEAINFLQKNRIGIGIHYKSIESFKYYKNKVKFNNAELKVSNLICKNIFSIPIYPDLTKVDQIYIIKKIKDFFHV